MDETAMATMLLAGSFRRVKKKEKTMTNATAKPDTSGMRKPKREYIGILYCLPYVVVFLFGMIIPMFYALYLSFFKQSLLGGTTFAGFDNFIRAFKDEALWGGFKNVLIYAAIQIPMNLILSLVAALILDSQRIRHIAVPRILLFLPYAVPGVIAALMWGYIYGDKYGLWTNRRHA